MKGKEVLLGAALAVLLAACNNSNALKKQSDDVGMNGDSSNRENTTITDDTTSETTDTGTDPTGTGIGLNGDTYTGDTTGMDTTDEDNLMEPYEFDVNGVGYEGDIVFKVKARETLKVQFIPLGAPTTIKVDGKDSGYFAPYGKLMVYIKVGKVDTATPLLSNGLDRAAQVSPVMDFSSAIKTACTGQGASRVCPDTIDVIVHRPNYDYWARNYSTYCFYPKNAQAYCTDHTWVYPSHPWAGTLRVQTEETEAL